MSGTDLQPPASLLEALDPEQREVAQTLRGPVRVLAGAGSGKTRAITHRIAFGVASGTYAPSEVLALSFTTRAAGEMRGRLRSLGAGTVQARTFHSAALRQLGYFWPMVYQRDLPQLTESKLPVIGLTARRLRMSPDQAQLRDVAAEIEWSKVSNVLPDTYEERSAQAGRSVGGLSAAEVSRLFAGYEETKREQGRMDMEDVLLLTAGMLAENPSAAEQVRRQYRWFVVDEFQDVSPLQSALLDLWLGGRDELCVVGDPSQTIYSFAGARSDYLRGFTTKFPKAATIELVRNYRSTPQVVAAANTLLAGTPSAGVTLRAQRPPGEAVRFADHPDEIAEATAVGARIRELAAQGHSYGDMAVLCRINAQTEPYETAFGEADIPFTVRGAARFFERPEVREALTRIRGLARSGEGERSGEQLLDCVRDTLAAMGWDPTPPTARGSVRNRWESWQALVSQAEDFAGNDRGDLAAFTAELEQRAADQFAPTAAAVTLATMHAAKGLEWDSVFLVGCQDGTLPITYADTPAAIEEERRLLYVGMTRARVQLQITWAKARLPGQQPRRSPSRFLTPLLPEQAQPQSKRSRRRYPTCRECGAPLSTPAQKKVGRCSDCPARYDEALYERLRAWRKTTAEADSKPAFVIFTDATLQLIAEHQPVTAHALLAINGVGEAKLRRHGDELLDLMEEYVDADGANSPAESS